MRLEIRDKWRAPDAVVALRDDSKQVLLSSETSDFPNIKKLAEQVVQSPEEFLDKPLEVLQQSFAIQEMERKFQRHFFASSQKNLLVSDVQAWARSMGLSESQMGLVHLIADEHVMNALYNAPVDKDGVPIFNSLHRQKSVVLDQRQQAKLIAAASPSRIFVGCTDQYGSLDFSRLLNRLVDCFPAEGLASAREGTGGAGLGFKMMIEQTDLCIIVVQKRRRTSVFFSFPTGQKISEGKNLILVEAGK